MRLELARVRESFCGYAIDAKRAGRKGSAGHAMERERGGFENDLVSFLDTATHPLAVSDVEPRGLAL